MALKVFDLQCEHDHVFEGWFSSHDDYAAQQVRGLVTCPICASSVITKRLSAPRLNVSHLHAPATQPASPQTATAEQEKTNLQVALMQGIRALVRKAENVGPRFAEEARRIHEGEADERPIRGTATQDERASLAEAGIDVMALPDIFDDDRLH